MLTLAHVRHIAPNADARWAEVLVATWPQVVRTGELSSVARVRHFLAQTAEESGGYRVFEENLNYSAKRLVAVWPSRFPTVAAAASLAGRPEALANTVYGGRRDLGNTQPGDGWRYRGRGPIQATGRAWAEKLTRALGIDLVAEPDRLLDPSTGWLAAAAIWTMSGAGAFADRGDLEGETRRLNGGLTNLAERRRYLALAQAVPPGSNGSGAAETPHHA